MNVAFVEKGGRNIGVVFIRISRGGIALQSFGAY
jgi:hypothetical protein